MTLNQFRDTQNLFHYFNSRLTSLSSQLDSKPPKVLTNDGLKSAASRLSIPKRFGPYARSIEKVTGRIFDDNLTFTKEEIIDTDLEMIKRFKVENFNYSKINIKLLLRSGIESAVELGIIKRNGEKHKLLSIQNSAKSYVQTTSAGYPTFKPKGSDLASIDAIKWVKKYIHNPVVSDLLSQPCAIFHRFQYKVKTAINGKYNVTKKIRPVWGAPFRFLVLEGVFFRDMLDNVQKVNMESSSPISTTGLTRTQISEKVISPFRNQPHPVFSIDFKSFDSYVPTYFWSLFYAIYVQSIDLNKKQDLCLKTILSYHAFTPFCYRSGEVQYKKRGIASGILLTSVFDTWVSRTIYRYTLAEYTNDQVPLAFMHVATGDDNLFADPGNLYKHYLSVVKRFGMKVDPNSTVKTDRCSIIPYAGVLWDIENRPTQAEEWYIARLCLPSRFLKVTKIPLPVLQTSRGICLCMGLFGGMIMFEKLVGWDDYIYKDLIKRWKYQDSDLKIHYVGEDQKMMGIGIPLSTIFGRGWSAF